MTSFLGAINAISGLVGIGSTLFQATRDEPAQQFDTKSCLRGVVERDHALAARLCPKIAAGPGGFDLSRSFKQEPIEWH